MPAVKILALVVAVFLGACSSHPPKVECEKHLKAINAPAPVTRGETPQS